MLLCLLKGPANTAAHSFPTWANPVPEDRIPAGFSVLQLHTAHPGVPPGRTENPAGIRPGRTGFASRGTSFRSELSQQNWCREKTKTVQT